MATTPPNPKSLGPGGGNPGQSIIRSPRFVDRIRMLALTMIWRLLPICFDRKRLQSIIRSTRFIDRIKTRALTVI